MLQAALLPMGSSERLLMLAASANLDCREPSCNHDGCLLASCDCHMMPA